MKKMQTLAVAAALAALASSALAAGDVTAALTGRTLTLTGDASSNSVVFTSGGATNAVTVTPTNGTTLNGSAAAATFTSVRSLVARMGAGDDRLDLTNVRVHGNATIRLDEGDDSLFFTGSTIRGRVIVRCGAGRDLVRTDANADFHRFVGVRGEAGNDELQFVNCRFRQWLHADAGGDDDHVLLQGVVASAGARVELFCGRGFDLVEAVSCQFGDDLFADTGPGDDRVRLAFSVFGLDASCYGGNGSGDVLSIEGVNSFRRLQRYDGFEEGEPRTP